MIELQPSDVNELDEFERLVYDRVRSTLQTYEGREIDATRTRFSVSRSNGHIDRVGCEVRRVAGRGLDLDIGFDWQDQLLNAGPPPPVGRLTWRQHWMIWEPNPWDFDSLDKHADEVVPFLHDWLNGRLTFITTFAGSVPCRWTLKRGDEVLGDHRRILYPWWRRRRFERRAT